MGIESLPRHACGGPPLDIVGEAFVPNVPLRCEALFTLPSVLVSPAGRNGRRASVAPMPLLGDCRENRQHALVAGKLFALDPKRLKPHAQSQ